jgi:hypothetical protein
LEKQLEVFVDERWVFEKDQDIQGCVVENI